MSKRTDGAATAAAGHVPGALGDAWNPVLVKEIRQALRGKMFRGSFISTLTMATMLGVGAIMFGITDSREEMGAQVFMPVFFCLAISLQVLVPFSCFVSMGAEWDENTWDLLVLSDLKPRRILLGKLLAASTQAMLFLSVYGPFLVFAFLLRGLAPLPIFVLIACSLFASTALSTLALWLSSLTTQRFLRVLLLAMLAAGLVSSVTAIMGFAQQLTSQPQILQDQNFQAVLGFVFVLSTLVSGFFFAAGCARLAHAEENRSSGLRALTAVVNVAALLWLLYLVPLIGIVAPVYVVTTVLMGVFMVPTVIFLTEPENLGRRVRLDVPRSRLVALLVVPFLPGNGRAMIYLLLNLLLLYVGAMLVAFATAPPSFGTASGSAVGDLPMPWSEGMSSVFVAALYVIAYLGLMSLIVGGMTRTVKRRAAARALVFVAWIPILVLPVLVAFLTGEFDAGMFQHPGNAGWVVSQAWSGGFPAEARSSFVLVGALAAIAVLLQLPRMVRGVREVLQASARRRAATRRAGAGAQS